MKFKAGDVVQLKSGSPSMTIIEMTAKGQALCVWFVNNLPVTHHFSPDVLDAGLG